MQEISVHSTNDKWEKAFIDRTKIKNSITFRMIELINFGIYLQTNEQKKLIGSNNFESMDKFQYLLKPCKILLKFKSPSTQGFNKIIYYLNLIHLNLMHGLI